MIDNLIVGGGITGVFLSYFLCSKTLIIEKYKIGSGATSLSCGTIYSPFKSHTDMIMKEITYSNLKSYLSAKSISIYKSLPAKFEMKDLGALFIGSSKSKQMIQTMYDKGISSGQTIYHIKNKDIEKIEPNISTSYYNHAIYAPHSFEINPSEMLHKLSDCINIKENTEIISIKQSEKSQKYKVALSDGSEIECKRIFLTNGIGINDVAHFFHIHVPIFPVKGFIMSMFFNKFNTSNMIFSADSFYEWSQHQTVPHNVRFNANIEHFYMKPYHDGLWAGFDRSIETIETKNNTKINEAIQIAQRLFPNIQHDGGYWYGIMPFPLYGKPIVGSLKHFNHPNVWILNGFGPSGIALAPAVCEIVSKIINFSDSSIIAKSLLQECDPKKCGITYLKD